MPYFLRYFVYAAILASATLQPLAFTHAALWDLTDKLVPCGNEKTWVENGDQICYTYGGDAGECSYCDLVVLAQNILKLLAFLGVVLATLLFVYAGILYLSASASPGNVSKAHKVFLNAVVGLIIILAAWLVLDVILKTLYADDSTGWGPWNEILCKGENEEPFCITKRAGLSGYLDPAVAPTGGASSSLNRPAAGGSGVQCPPTNVACSVDALTAAGLTPQQANVMSCIAMTESSGRASTPPYNVTHPGSNSSACGTFQITKTTWNSVKDKPTGCVSHASCMIASCNIAVTKALVQRGGYRDWTCANCNNKAQGCINKYSTP